MRQYVVTLVVEDENVSSQVTVHNYLTGLLKMGKLEVQELGVKEIRR